MKGKRYQELFTLSITDYAGWAHGLKRCGYATDPLYAEKLINMIETYGLDKLVTDKPSKVDKPHEENKSEHWKHPVLRHPVKRRHGINFIMAVLGDTYQDIASEFDLKLNKLLDYNDLKNANQQPEVGDIIYVNKKHNEAQGTHDQYRVNDDAETLWHISQMFGIRLKDLAKINNLKPDAPLHKGDVIKLKR